MDKIIKYLISQIKEQYYWRAEDSEWGGLETDDGWSLKESELLSEIQKITTSNSEYNQCNYCHGTKILCRGAGQCDHDGSECNLISNCGEYVPAPCKYCNN